MFGSRFFLAIVAATTTMAIAGTALTAGVGGSQASNTATFSGAIGKYNIDQVTYNRNVNTPANVDSITFRILAPGHSPSIVRARPVSTASFYTCSVGSPTSGNYPVTCATTSPQWTLVNNLVNMQTLTVVIRQ